MPKVFEDGASSWIGYGCEHITHGDNYATFGLHVKSGKISSQIGKLRSGRGRRPSPGKDGGDPVAAEPRPLDEAAGGDVEGVDADWPTVPGLFL